MRSLWWRGTWRGGWGERIEPKGNDAQVMPQETHVGYIESYLDALKNVQNYHEWNPNMSIRDICFAMKISIWTTIVAGGIISIPDDLTSFPSVAQLLQKTVG